MGFGAAEFQVKIGGCDETLHCFNVCFKSLITPGLSRRSFSPTNVRWMSLKMWMCTYPTRMLLPRRRGWTLGSTPALRSTPQRTWMT